MSDGGATVPPATPPPATPALPGAARAGATLGSAALGSVRQRVLGVGPVGDRPAWPQWARLAAFLVVAGLTPLVVQGTYELGIATLVLIYVIVALGFYLMFCLTGQFAFSQAAMFGLGAYITNWAERFTDVWFALVLAVALTAAIGAVLLLIVHRASELYFAIATLGFAQVVILIFQNWREFAGTAGEAPVTGVVNFFGTTVNSAAGDYWFVFVFAGAALVLVKLIELSPLRRDAIAVRDHERVALSLGTNTMLVRLVMFALGSAFAAGAGALFAQTQGYIAPGSFEVTVGINIFLIVILGGTGSMWGAVIGSAIVVSLPDVFRSVANYSALAFAGVLLIVIFLMPRGFVGLVQPARDLLVRMSARNRPRAAGEGGVPA